MLYNSSSAESVYKSSVSIKAMYLPLESDKPVFEAESSAGKNAVRAAELWLFWPAALVHAAVSPWTADTLTIRDLTIEIYGSNSCGIDVSDLSKPVYIKNVNFVGKGNNVFSYRGGSNVHISK